MQKKNLPRGDAAYSMRARQSKTSVIRMLSAAHDNGMGFVRLSLSKHQLPHERIYNESRANLENRTLA